MANELSLTADDINTLLDSVSAWERAKQEEGFSSSLLTAMIVPRDKGESDWKAVVMKPIEAVKEETERRKRSAIMLKAKLVHLLDRTLLNGQAG
jgi:hypothetical protein